MADCAETQRVEIRQRMTPFQIRQCPEIPRVQEKVDWGALGRLSFPERLLSNWAGSMSGSKVL